MDEGESRYAFYSTSDYERRDSRSEIANRRTIIERRRKILDMTHDDKQSNWRGLKNETADYRYYTGRG